MSQKIPDVVYIAVDHRLGELISDFEKEVDDAFLAFQAFKNAKKVLEGSRDYIEQLAKWHGEDWEAIVENQFEKTRTFLKEQGIDPECLGL